jgi:hypothetical protein
LQTAQQVSPAANQIRCDLPLRDKTIYVVNDLLPYATFRPRYCAGGQRPGSNRQAENTRRGRQASEAVSRTRGELWRAITASGPVWKMLLGVPAPLVINMTGHLRRYETGRTRCLASRASMPRIWPSTFKASLLRPCLRAATHSTASNNGCVSGL